jgi:hypothetical protein
MNKATYKLGIQMLGIPGTITHIKTGVVKAVPKLGIANARNVGDVNIVNAYGVNARIVTIFADDLPFELTKFDTVDIPGEKLVVDSVIEVHEPGTGAIIGYRGIIRGK